MKPSALLIAKILTLFGISLTCTACYGVPQVDYIVKGTVTDTGGKPLEGIRVVQKVENDENDANLRRFRDTVYSRDGQYAFRSMPFRPTGEWILIATDIDGAENGGEFAACEKRLLNQAFA